MKLCIAVLDLRDISLDIRLRELQEKRAAAKGEIVARRLETLLREAEGLGWGEPGSGAPEWDDPAAR